MENTKDKSVIPFGMYCYTPIGYYDGKYSVKLCPYWSLLEDKPQQENGYCSYMELGDGEEGVFLLFDQCKECGINME